MFDVSEVDRPARSENWQNWQDPGNFNHSTSSKYFQGGSSEGEDIGVERAQVWQTMRESQSYTSQSITLNLETSRPRNSLSEYWWGELDPTD